MAAVFGGIRTTVRAMMLSGVFRACVDGDEEEEVEVPVQGLNEADVHAVVEFCEHYADYPLPELPQPLPPTGLALPDEWYKAFASHPKERLCKLAWAADAAEVEPMRQLVAAALGMEFAADIIAEEWDENEALPDEDEIVDSDSDNAP